MRNIIVAAIALALGCATTAQQETKSQALSAQDQAHQSLQAAADAQEQTLSGRVVRRSGDQLRVRTDDQGLMNLDVTDATAVSLDGRSGSLDQIQPGSDVRASYQMIDGKAKALKIDVTSSSPRQDQSTPPPKD